MVNDQTDFREVLKFPCHRLLPDGVPFDSEVSEQLPFGPVRALRSRLSFTMQLVSTSIGSVNRGV